MDNLNSKLDLQNINIEELNKILNKLSPIEKEAAISVLQEYINTGHSSLLDELIMGDYAEVPVDIETFVDSPQYLRAAWYDGEDKCKLYPYWRKELKKIFPDNVTTSVNNTILSGSRGRGKTEISMLIAAYMLYRILCLKNPIQYFHLKSTEKIVFAFMNIKLALAEEIATSKFQNTLQSSPWFLAHGTIEGRTKKMWVPQKYPDSEGNLREVIDIKIGSQADDLIGLPIYFAFFDEVSFQRNQDVEKQKEKAKDMINTAIGGMKTRFVYKGKNPTMLVLASSKRSDKSFLEEHMRKKLKSEGENTYISDGSVWEAKPEGTYSKETFNVALGNKFLQSMVIPDGEDVEPYLRKGYKILPVPIDFKADFLDDIDRALCDFAGISSSAISKYISGAAFDEVVNQDLENPFQQEILTIGDGPDDRDVEYYNFFDITKIPKELKNKPLFVHLDMSKTHDKTGIAGVFIKGKKPSTDPNLQSKDLFYTVAFSTSIKAPKGREISFEKNRNFIRWLKKQGFKLKGISSDTYQSADLQQILKAEGYPMEIISVDRVDTDRVCKPYSSFKSAIYERRIEFYPTNLLRREITDLERNLDSGKVDHPDDGCFTGDTKVRLTDGRSLSFFDLIKEYESGKQNYVYSLNLDKKIIEPKKILKAWKTLENQPLVKLTFDNGESVKCTLTHKFMLRNGEYIEAQDLLPNELLMPLNDLKNHKLITIEFLDETADVYDIEVEDNHNFALDAGVFVHNSKDVSDAVCLHGDTEVYLLSGQHKPIKELYKNFENQWVLAYNTLTKKLEPVRIINVLNNGVKNNLIKITLDNGKELTCTEDHLLLTRDGNYIQAKDSLDVSLMPFSYEHKVMYKNRDYPYIYQPNDDLTVTGIYLHKLVAENIYAEEKLNKQKELMEGQWVVIHHKDCNRFNNNPENLEYLTNVEHSIKHASLNTTDTKRKQLSEANKKRFADGSHIFLTFTKEELRKRGHDNSVKWNKSERHRQLVSECNKKLVALNKHNFQLGDNNLHSEKANKKRQLTCLARYNSLNPLASEEIQKKCRESCLKNNGYDNPFRSKAKQHEMSITRLKNWFDKVKAEYSINDDEVITLLDFKIMSYALGSSGVPMTETYIKEANLPIDCSNSDLTEEIYKEIRALGSCIKQFLKETGKQSFTYEEFLNYHNNKIKSNINRYRYRFSKIPVDYNLIIRLGFKLYNHRVIKIESVPAAEVYDLQLDKIHNFALCVGIFVHNCGAMFNASKHAEEFAYDYGETAEEILKINTGELIDDRQQLTLDLENELQKMYQERSKQQSLDDDYDASKRSHYDWTKDVIIM